MTGVPTARGVDIDASDLGMTLMHEHVLLAQTAVLANWPHLFDREAEIAEAARDLQEVYELGVRTIVDLTTVDLGRDVAFVKAVAEQTDVQIVVATGVHLNPPPYFRRQNMDPIIDLYVRDITVGIAETGVRAGCLKVASEEEVTEEHATQLRAIARAHRATGVPIMTHTRPAVGNGLAQQRIFQEEGVDLSRVVIGHSGDTPDLEYLTRLMEAGSTIGMDRFGTGLGATTEQRIDTIAELCRRGWASQMVLSHDTSAYSMGLPRHVRVKRLPEYTFRLIPSRVLPALLERGVTDEQIQAMMVANPRRIFEAQGAY